MRFGGGSGGSHISIVGGKVAYNDSAQTTRFTDIFGSGGTDSGTETARQAVIPIGCTFSLLILNIFSNAKTGSVIVTLRTNGINVNETITIGAGLTGDFQDTINTDTVIVGDKMSLGWNAAGSGAFLLICDMTATVCAT